MHILGRVDLCTVVHQAALTDDRCRLIQLSSIIPNTLDLDCLGGLAVMVADYLLLLALSQRL